MPPQDIPLICPACRVPGPPGRQRQGRVVPDGERALACPACGARHPVVDGVACMAPDVAAFEAAQRWALDPDAPPLAVSPADADVLCGRLAALDPASDAFREARLLGQHAAAQYPESRACIGLDDGLADNVATLAALERLVRSAAPPSDAPIPAILDAGCGPGRLAMDLADAAPAGAVAFDLRIAPLRLAAAIASGRDARVGFLAEGRRFEPLTIPGRRPGGPVRGVQGDVLAPPFPAESFAAVIAVSLLDTVHDPIVALGQLDALLAPGGVLLLASPWAWDPAVTPPAWWLGDAAMSSGDALCRALAGQSPALPHLDCEVLHRSDLPWALPGNARLVHRYRLEAVLARKRARRRGAP